MALVGPFVDTSVNPAFYTNTAPAPPPAPPVLPVTIAPNLYTPGSRYRRITFTAVGPVDVWAIPWNGNLTTTVGAWLDGAYSTTLSYAGALGVKAKQTLTPPDGNPHTWALDEQAVITNILGNVTFTTPPAPDVCVLEWGDSVTLGINATVFSNSYSALNAHGLPSNFNFINWGVSGKVLTSNGGDYTYVLAALNGTVKNIVIVELQVNDWNNGEKLSFYTTSLDQFIAGINAAARGIKILLKTVPNTNAIPVGGSIPAGPNLNGFTLEDFRQSMRDRAAGGATPAANCFLLDLFNPPVYPVTPPGIYSADGIHPTDLGESTIAPVQQAAILAL